MTPTPWLSHPARLLCHCFGAAQRSGLDLQGGDNTVRCQDDLYRAANGGWLAQTEIPPDKASAGSFASLVEACEQSQRRIVEALVPTAPTPGSVQQRVRAFFVAFMDTQAMDAAGLAPVAELLGEIDAIQTPAQLAQWQGRMQGVVNTPLSLSVAADFAQPGRHRVLVWQGGLGLPDKDCLLRSDDARMAQVCDAYAAYLRTLATLMGDAQPGHSAGRVLALERRIAALHWDSVDNRDAQKINNPTTVDALLRSAPGFDWPAFLQAAQLRDATLGNAQPICVSQPSAAAGIARLMADVPLADWRLYFKLRLLDTLAATLPEAFRNARFAFHGLALAGASAEPPRWQLAIQALNRALGDDMGQLYVARHFTPAHKAHVQTLVGQLLAAYHDAINELPWMTAATQARAQAKLSRYQCKIGYPEVWRDCSDLHISQADALGNTLRAAQFAWQQLAAKAQQPVDRSEWAITPQTVNAYYDPSRNEVVFPAAILHPPFFDIAADDAVNYGAIGAIIGHEISHGFDDQGSKFDGDGTLRDWWLPADREAFEALAAQLVAQFEQYEPLPGRRLNARLTLGENIADLAGLQIAYKAYLRASQGRPEVLIDGHTAAQRFFLGWAQVWRDKVRPARALQLLCMDPHAPAEFRANGAAINHDGFHSAFHTQPADKMFKPAEQRIRIW